ncbi:MAG: DUF4058 family protein [Isosphaeraceae bacterium]
MPSPFPGMDPYLEQPGVWHDFHERFLPAAAAQISAQVLPRYFVLIDEHVYLHETEWGETRPLGRPDLTLAGNPGGVRPSASGLLEAPAQVVVPNPDVERDSFLKVVDNRSREVVTVIELLSPTNKRPGVNRERYLAKRAEVLNSPAHLVEIDLLRTPQPMPAEGRPACEYSVLVSRVARRPGADFWPVGLRQLLPVIPVPLREGEPDARLDLRAAFDRVYDEAGYRYFAYTSQADPPLTPEDAAWATEIRLSSEATRP